MRILFFCYPQGPPEKAGYQHQLVALAEGLTELGIPFFGNINYWKKSADSNEYLIKETSFNDLNEFDIVIVPSTLFDYKATSLLPDNLFNKVRNYKIVFIDSADGLTTPGFFPEAMHCDLVLKSHYCKKYTYPPNFRPWQFGLTNRIIEAVKPLNFEDREHVTLSNFRVNLSARLQAENTILPAVYKYYPANKKTETIGATNELSGDDLMYWEQTGRRHNPAYYTRLGQAKLCNAIGGNLQKPIAGTKNVLLQFLEKIDRRFHLWPYDRIYQFDSWRFWESLASGCCTLHLDFKKFGMMLPVMPENLVHYFPLDFYKQKSIKDLIKDDELIQRIAANGRAWANTHYAPVKTAERFLNLLS